MARVRRLLLLLSVLLVACSRPAMVFVDNDAGAPTQPSMTPEQLHYAACVGPKGEWWCSGERPAVQPAATTPIIPASWTVPAWYVDPANSTTTASDANDCATAVTPCLTWQEIEVHRWGTIAPRLRQNTVLNALSSPVSNAAAILDPLYLRPFVENQAQVSVQCPLGAPQQTATGTLSGTVAKNRTTPQLLNETLPAGAAIKQLVVNATHPSRAWTYLSLGGGAFSISQPHSASAIFPGAFGAVPTSEVDTWANGDSVTVYAPVKVNLVSDSPIVADVKGSGTFNNDVSVYQCWVMDPGAFVGAETLEFNNGGYINFIESLSDKVLSFSTPAGGIENPYIVNSYIAGGFQTAVSGSQPFSTNNAAVVTVWGGLLRGNVVIFTSSKIDGDVILHPGVGSAQGSGLTTIGKAYIASPFSLQVGPFGGATMSSSYAGGPIVWGAGNFNATGSARVTYPSGAGQAAATFPLTGAITINGSTTAHSVFTAANVDTPCGGINVTAANLDLASSATCATTGFGGLAFNYGGASITNGGL